MAGLQDIRRRIRSVKNTQQVTKAMKMISAVKLRKSQERLVALRPYASKMLEVVARRRGPAPAGRDPARTPLTQAFLAPREEQAHPRGGGGRRQGALRRLQRQRAQAGGCALPGTRQDIVQLDVVGKRAADWARKHGLKPNREFIGTPLPGLAKVAEELAAEAVRAVRGRMRSTPSTWSTTTSRPP